tara:strand:- start:4 stop:354 length:351 start_codon:yes stop_codon:yes gene_type:complete
MTDNNKTHSGIRRGIDKAEDAIGAAVGQVTAKLNAGDTYHFAKNALLGDIYKIEAARLALKRSRSAQVQNMSKVIMDVHGRSKNDLSHLVGDIPALDALKEELDWSASRKVVRYLS